MRLFELIDYEIKDTDRSYKNTKDKVVSVSDPLGSGHFSKVYKHDSPKRLNQVTKVGKAGSVGIGSPKRTDDLTKDGYLSYITMVNEFQKSGGQNPFFPNINKLKIYRDDEGLHYTINLEKLYDIKTPKIFNNHELMNSMKEELLNVEEFKWMEDINLASCFLYVTDMPTRDMIDAAKDESLKEALKLIDDVKRKHGLEWDLGPQNVMWRMTGTRPQVVITDPLA